MTEVAPPRRPLLRSFLYFLRDVLVIFGIAILVSFLVKTFLVRSFFIPSASMEQTLMIDDRVIVNELVPKAVAVEHGDIVVFKGSRGMASRQTSCGGHRNPSWNRMVLSPWFGLA